MAMVSAKRTRRRPSGQGRSRRPRGRWSTAAEPGGDVEGDREDGLAVGLVEAGEGAAGVGRLELGGGQGVVDAVVVGVGRPVEAVELVVQDAR